MEDEPPPGVPEWVVTYGDMMSLLLTFFIMLVSLSEVVADKKYRAVLESLNKKFSYRHGPVAPPGRSFPLNGMLVNLSTLGSFATEDPGHGGVKQKSVTGADFRTWRTREGDGLPVNEPVLFDSDSATAAKGWARNLDEIAKRLAGIPNKVEIRAICPVGTAGNTAGAGDPARTRICYARTRFVQAYLERNAVAPERLRLVIAGEGAERDDGEGRMRSPDRVEVYVLDTHVHEFVGPRSGE